MIALRIEDIRQFTASLFLGDLFDRFLVREVSIVTFNEFTIDGRIRHGYYTEEELEAKKIEEFSSWSVVKPICFSLIKGKKLPNSFQIVLQISPADVEKFLFYSQLAIRAEQVKGLYMNIQYEDGRLNCVTGTSINFFTLDKSLDTEWDEAVKLFFKEKQIPYTLPDTL